MRKTLLGAVVCSFLLMNFNSFSQTRYLEEVFSSVDVTSNVNYGQNYSVLTGTPVLFSLNMDVYEPAGDTATNRPLIVYLHTGSFLPRYINQLPTGARTDSATVEICKRLARQGYVVAAPSYRLGWNPQAPAQEDRTQTIIQAVYRGLQDAKTCVRFFRKEADSGNQYGIDEDKIAVGGQGSGGYISLAYGSLDKLTEIQMTKFYNFTTGAFMVDTAVYGNWDGLGGNPGLNYSNHSGYSSHVNCTFHIGGAIGDSTWINDGEIPIISIQGVADAYAPYSYGIVNVPGTSLFVVDVSGSSDIQRINNAFGNNDLFKSPAMTDAFSLAANAKNTAMDGTYGNGGDEGLFPFVGLADGNGPWEWFDSTSVKAEAAAMGQDPDAVLANGYAGNPVYQALGEAAGAMRAKAFCDTIQGYVSPRLYRALIEQPVGISETKKTIALSVYPNPAVDVLNFEVAGKSGIRSIQIYNLSSQLVKSVNGLKNYRYSLSTTDISSGLYFVKVSFDGGDIIKKVIIK